MDVAIPFKFKGKLNDKVQQYNIFFNPNENDFDTLIDFIQESQDKIINIEYRNGIDVKTASALSKISDNVRFRLRAEDIQKTSQLREKGCKYFFDNSLAVESWTDLYRFVNDYGVSDVYVCNDLVYQLDKVCEYCHKNQTKVRFVVNRAPLSFPIKGDNFIAPIYRPQDVPVLEKIGIDVIEFDCGNPYNFDMLKVLYKTYIVKHFWYGQLGEINPDFKDYDMPCPGLTPILADKRSKCGLRCLTGRPCRTCRNLVTLAQDLRDINAQLAV